MPPLWIASLVVAYGCGDDAAGPGGTGGADLAGGGGIIATGGIRGSGGTGAGGAQAAGGTGAGGMGGDGDGGDGDGDGGPVARATVGPSCVDGATACMAGGNPVSCCESTRVDAGTFAMGRRLPLDDACSPYQGAAHEQPQHDATVAGFYLDRFEVTVGRYRRFFEAYAAGFRPAAGQAAHPRVSGSGWRVEWDGLLPVDGSAHAASLACGVSNPTWSDAVGDAEQMPINCVDWYQAFAFCAWDGGRLPTEAEWEYASAGGDEVRLYPWGAASPDASLANHDCNYSGTCPQQCPTPGILPVGSLPMGVGRFGQYNLAGNVTEWVLDWLADYDGACEHCAVVDAGTARVFRGGSWFYGFHDLRAAHRNADLPERRGTDRGFRCARDN